MKQSRIALEIFILLFHLYYWKILLQNWWLEWKKYRYTTPYHEKLEKSKISYILDIDFSQVINDFFF